MADDWADEYDPTNPDGPEPKNMQKTDPIGDWIESGEINTKSPSKSGGKVFYDPIRTNLGPVGFIAGAPQVDPLPYETPPELSQMAKDLGGPMFGPQVDIRANEGPFFTQSNRRGGQNEAHRDISDFLQNMMTPADTKVGSTWRSLDMNNWAKNAEHMPSHTLRDHHFADAHYFPLTPMGVELGGTDLDKYHQAYHPPNFPRDDMLANDMSNQDDAVTVLTMPEYMQKGTAEQLAKDAMDSKMESETVWEGKTAPTQADIDKVKANPTDGMIQMFEDQFGAEATSKVFPDDEESVPLPKARPKEAPKRRFGADPLTSARDGNDPADDWDRMMNDWEQGIKAETPENRGKSVDRTPEDSTAAGKYNKRKASKR